MNINIGRYCIEIDTFGKIHFKEGLIIYSDVGEAKERLTSQYKCRFGSGFVGVAIEEGDEGCLEMEFENC